MIDYKALCAELLAGADEYTGMNPYMRLDNAMKAARLALAAEPEPLPSNYIDSEYTGQDRELLEIFYAACQAEGGTADEIQLRGIRAVLAATEPVAPVPVSARPWEREGWCDAKGWCWWFDEEGTGWVFAAPGPWNLAQWYLPHHAIPQPASLADEEPKITEDPLSRQTPEPVSEGPSNEDIMALMPPQMHEDLAAAARAMAGFDSPKAAMGAIRNILNCHAVDHARAVLARWGHTPNA
jgi:hypothetical protein